MHKRPGMALSVVRSGLVCGTVLVALTAHVAVANELFVYPDQAERDDAMTTLGELLAENVDLPTPCRLDIINDMRGETLFDDATLDAMSSTLATSVLGAVDGCVIETRELSQEDASGYLVEQRQAGKAGLAAILAYYKIGDKVNTLATLRDAAGRLVGSTTGLFELPAVPATVGSDVAAVGSDDAVEPSPQVQPAEVQPAAPTPVAEPRPVIDRSGTAEASLRRQIADDTRIAAALDRPFNIRRIDAGIPSSIRTVRVADTGGLDAAMMADLAEVFLDDLAVSPAASIKTSDYGSNGQAGIEVAVEGAPGLDLDAIDIESSDAEAAFEKVLDNEIDIVVTRDPISADDADRFARTYGVNMRSRYAEHVIGIGTGEVDLLSCGIDYPQEEILMSTEDHPTSERIYLYTNPSVPSDTRDRFVDFALSAEGQEAVANHTFDLRLHMSGARYAIWRHQVAGNQEPALPEALSRFRSLIRTSERLSTTFRFDFASSDLVLDSRSEQDLDNLIDLIKSEGIDSRRVLLFGFADSVGPAPFNADLSRDRADAVATRLRLAGIPVPRSNVYGIGEDSPIACDEEPDGTRNELGALKNRRVEVWIES